MRQNKGVLPVTYHGATRSGGERQQPPGMLEVNVERADDDSQVLEAAVKVISASAESHHVGIMITRIGNGRYIVRAHPGVPYGFVRQGHR